MTACLVFALFLACLDLSKLPTYCLRSINTFSIQILQCRMLHSCVYNCGRSTVACRLFVTIVLSISCVQRFVGQPSSHFPLIFSSSHASYARTLPHKSIKFGPLGVKRLRRNKKMLCVYVVCICILFSVSVFIAVQILNVCD